MELERPASAQDEMGGKGSGNLNIFFQFDFCVRFLQCFAESLKANEVKL